MAGIWAQNARALTVTVYTSRASWETAAGTWTEETFDDVTLLPGVSFALNGVGHTGAGVSGGVFNDRLEPGSSTVWTIPTAAGFGGNWDLRPGGAGLGLQMTAGTEVVTTQIADTYAGGFFGIITDFDFTSLTLMSGTQGGVAETYNLDNMVMAAPLSAVPEPSSFLLLGLAGVGAIVVGRRRRK